MRQIAALVFIYLCTTVAWFILAGTIWSRTESRETALSGKVSSTWGEPQQQNPPVLSYVKTEFNTYTTQEHGKEVVHTQKTEHTVPIALDSSRIKVDIQLDPRQKGLLWYSTYVVNYAGEYTIRNPTPEPQDITFRFALPSQKAVYDGLSMTVDGHPLPATIGDQGAVVHSVVAGAATSTLRISYRSQGLGSWRYKLGEQVAQVHDFTLEMTTNFQEIDFADDTLSPTTKHPISKGWELTWRYADLVSGFQIGMTMPDHLQPGPLAGQISTFAPVSLFFFFFLMFIISTLRNIELHPMNYFFLATAFFAFHLLLAYLVDHISIHAAMIIASVVSILLVVSYLRLVVGIRFAALEAGTAQLIYLVLFSYAFFWKGFTGLAITIISIGTLFVVMQATGRIRWAEKFTSLSSQGSRK
jgi:hypothetical protein